MGTGRAVVKGAVVGRKWLETGGPWQSQISRRSGAARVAALTVSIVFEAGGCDLCRNHLLTRLDSG